MKRIGILIMVSLISSLSVLADESTKIIAPSSIGEGDIHLIAMDGDGEAIESDDITITKSDYFGDASVFTVDITDETGKVKMVAGYKIDGKYVLIASAEITGDADLADNYSSTPDDELLEIIKISDYNDYESFPGLEMKDGSVLLGLRAGEENHETSEIPSNIVEKFGVDASGGYTVTFGDGTSINPNNSESNYEFTITDKDGNPVVIMKDDKEYTDSETGIIDLKNLKKAMDGQGQVYPPNDNPDTDIDESDISDLAPFTIRVRFKGEVLIDGIAVSQKTFEFGNIQEPVLIYEGSGNSFVLDLSDEEITFEEEELPPELAKPTVYVITGEGLVTKGTVDMLSREEASKKQRASDVNIEIMEQGESGFEVKTISE